MKPLLTTGKFKIMKISGQKLANILDKLEITARPGINLLQIEKKAWQLIENAGGYPSFAKVPGYSHATCLSINDGLVHGLPPDYLLREGDVLNIDIGLLYKKHNSDCAKSFIVGNKGQKGYKQKNIFLNTGKKTLKKAISKATAGNRVGDISQAIQEGIEKQSFYCSRKYTGHGIGKKLHQPPSIPCILRGKISDTPVLKAGTALAIEVIYMQKKSETTVLADGWTVKAKKGFLSSCFEKTVLVRKSSPLVLTNWK